MGNEGSIISICNMAREHVVEVLGNSAVQVIDSWLKQRGCRGIEDICREPEKVCTYMRMIFGDASILLKNEIVRVLEGAINSSSKDSEFIKDIISRIQASIKKRT
jgi:hypothetical protein